MADLNTMQDNHNTIYICVIVLIHWYIVLYWRYVHGSLILLLVFEHFVLLQRNTKLSYKFEPWYPNIPFRKCWFSAFTGHWMYRSVTEIQLCVSACDLKCWWFLCCELLRQFIHIDDFILAVLVWWKWFFLFCFRLVYIQQTKER